MNAAWSCVCCTQSKILKTNKMKDNFTHLQTFIEGVVKEAIETALIQNKELSTSDQLTSSKVHETEFLNVDQAAEFLHLAKQTVYTLTCKKRILFYKNGKKILFKKHELQEWMNSGRQTIKDLQIKPNLPIKMRKRNR